MFAAGVCGGLVMGYLDVLNWTEVRAHYKTRKDVHRNLVRLLRSGSDRDFTNLGLGMSNADGNYSASDHALGPKIVAMNPAAHRQVAELGEAFSGVQNGHDIPGLIETWGMRYLKIGVGSELSCMVNPQVCWVANTRTIWTHLVFKHDDLATADEALRLFRDEDLSSEMTYQYWTALHQEVVSSMEEIANEGNRLARGAGVRPGSVLYLWADAIANGLYAHHHG